MLSNSINLNYKFLITIDINELITNAAFQNNNEQLTKIE